MTTGAQRKPAPRRRTPGRTDLHVVGDELKPDPAKKAPAKKAAAKPAPKSFKEAAEQSERDLLVMMRNTISDALAGKPPAHTLPALMKQLKDVDKDIRLIDAKAAAEQEQQGNSGDDSSTSTDEDWDPEAI